MRQDMKKVVVERPRTKGIAFKQIRNGKNELIDGSMRAPYVLRRDRKSFTDLLGPLYRFLQGKLGEKWDSIYSEIRENLKSTSTTQIHIVDHVKQMVAIHVVEKEDGLYSHDNGNYYKLHSGEFYVDPKTSVLKQIPEKKKISYADKRQEQINLVYRNFGKEKEAYKFKGIWYWAIFQEVPLPVYYIRTNTDGTVEKVPYKQYIEEPEYFNIYINGFHYIKAQKFKLGDGGRYKSGKKQMTSEDLKKYGLKNDR